MFNFLTNFSNSYFSRENKDCVSYTGPFSNWDDAVSFSTGYCNSTITQKAVSAITKILSGEKKCEKDTILFDEYQYSLPLLLGLNFTLKYIKQKITVLDYGGSFASSFFRNFDILSNFNVRWIVVEQEHIVNIAKEKLCHFKNLEFISISNLKIENPVLKYDVLLLGSSLQFLKNPGIELKILLKPCVKSLIFEQTPFVTSGSTKLTVQQIREPIYDASYPAWHFDENEFLSWIGNHYEIKYQTHNPHVRNECGNFTSTLKDYVFTETTNMP